MKYSLIVFLFLSSFTNLTAGEIDFDNEVKKFFKKNTRNSTTKKETAPLKNILKDGTECLYASYIPKNYSEKKKYGLIVWLHGAVRRPKGSVNKIWQQYVFGKDKWIILAPMGWDKAPWWSEKQMENIQSLIIKYKKKYNIDDNKVFMSGFSDGATAAFFYASNNATPFAGFLPFMGCHEALRTVSHNSQFYLGNVLNSPIWMVYGEKDKLYPAERMKRLADFLDENKCDGKRQMLKNIGHSMDWAVNRSHSSKIKLFLKKTERNSYPDTIEWEVDNLKTSNRYRWLKINTLGITKSENPLKSKNLPLHDSKLKLGIILEPKTLKLKSVKKNSLAETLNMKIGDVIESLNNNKINSPEDLKKQLDKLGYEQKIKIIVKRDGASVTLSSVTRSKSDYPGESLFRRNKKSGHVILNKKGNIVRAKTKGVTSFTLLISPKHFDLSKPIEVLVNGEKRFSQLVEMDLAIFRKWAQFDYDKKMVFAAEILIDCQ